MKDLITNKLKQLHQKIKAWETFLTECDKHQAEIAQSAIEGLKSDIKYLEALEPVLLYSGITSYDFKFILNLFAELAEIE